jgi:hypothetical protein
VNGSNVSIILTGSESFPLVPDLEDLLSEAFGAPVTVTVEQIPSIVVIYSDEEGETRTEVKTDE